MAIIATHLEFWKKKGDTDRRTDPLSGTSMMAIPIQIDEVCNTY
jgi:hypothetical protein